MDDTRTELHKQVCQRLKTELDQVAQSIPSGARILYFDAPVYLNVGDLLIERGAEALFAAHGHVPENRFSTLDYKRAFSLIEPDHVLVFQGGGNMGDLWENHERLRQDVLARFPRNKAIILPQTLHFESEDKLRNASAIYSACEDLTLFLRDERSFLTAQSHVRAKCYLAPDTAHYLWGDPGFPAFALPQSTLTMTRKDDEASHIQKQSGVDWADIIRPVDVGLYKVFNLLMRLPLPDPVRKRVYAGWHAHRDAIITRCVTYFRQHDTLCTDRLHGMILGVLLGQDITMRDNSYGKLSSYARLWLSGLVTIETTVAPKSADHKKDAAALHSKMASGGLWLLLEKTGQQAINFLVFVIVARLIGPEEFGLAGLAMALPALSVFITTGLSDAVISKGVEKDEKALTTLFWAIGLIGAGMSLALFFSASGLSALFGDARYEPLLLWLAAFPLLNALSVIPAALIQSRMAFRIFALRSFLATALGGLLSITMAYHGFGALALVAQQLAMQVFGNLILWPSSSFRPRPVLDRAQLVHVLESGMKMTASSLLDYTEMQAPRLVIGYFLGPVAVGFYALGARLLTAFREMLVLPFTVVFYTALAQIKDTPQDAQKMIRTIIMIGGFITLPAFTGAAFTAQDYVPLFFGEKWVDAVPFLRIFLLAASTMIFLPIMRDILRSLGRLGAYVTMQGLLIMGGFTATSILAFFGLLPMAYGQIGVALISLILLSERVKTHSPFDVRVALLALWPFLLSCLVMVTGISLMRDHLTLPRGILLATEVLGGGALYLLSSTLLARKECGAMLRFVKERLAGKR